MWKLSYRKRHENGLLPPPIKTVDSHTAPGSCHMSAFATWIIASQTHCAVNQTLCINYVGISNVLCPMCASQLATMTACIPMSYTYIIPTQSNLQRQSFCAPSPHHWELKNHLFEVSKHPHVWWKANNAIIPCVCVFTNVFTHVQVHVSKCMGTGGGQRPTWSVISQELSICFCDRVCH